MPRTLKCVSFEWTARKSKLAGPPPLLSGPIHCTPTPASATHAAGRRRFQIQAGFRSLTPPTRRTIHYILKAFEFARQADPKAERYYNECDFEYRPKCKGGIRRIKDLRAKGARVDGLGIQGHWFLDFPRIDELEAYVLALAELKLKLMITELDLGVVPFCHLDSPIVDIGSFDAETRKKLDPYPDGLPEAVQEEQARRYHDLFSLFRKHRDKFSRVTFWGVHDGQSWRSYLPIKGRTEHPLLFDRRCEPKPSLDAIIETARE
jgi:endo-1,4-beta-xylanase